MKLENRKGGRPTTARAPWGELYIRSGSQANLAKMLGVSTSTVTKWARDVHRVPELAKKELMRLCMHYGVEEGIDRFKGF